VREWSVERDMMESGRDILSFSVVLSKDRTHKEQDG